MTKFTHPTAKLVELFDPLVNPPPSGASLLLINNGGVLIVGQWYEGALAWGYKPTIPASVKARLTQKQQHSEPQNEIYTDPEDRKVDADKSTW